MRLRTKILSVFPLLFLALLLILAPQNKNLSFLTIFGGLAYLLGVTSLFAQTIFREEKLLSRIILSATTISALIAIIGSVIYWTVGLTDLALKGMIFGLPILAILLKKSIPPFEAKNKTETERARAFLNLKNTVLFVSSCGFLILATILMFKAASYDSLRSPWEALRPQFFLLFFLSSMALTGLLFLNKKRFGAIFLITAHALLALTVAVIIFKEGFGFDPFIHRATEKHIFLNGAIEPKTPYYIGQYSLVVFLSKILGLQTSLIDLWLLPALAALTFPAAIFVFLKSAGFAAREAGIGAAAALILPYSSFTVTTPQGLANYFLLLTALFGARALWQKTSLMPSALFSAATAVTHLLAGVPAIIIFLLLLVSRNKARLSKTFAVFLFGLAGAAGFAALPLLFLFFGWRSGFSLEQIFKFTPDFANLPLNLPKFVNKFDAFRDTAYLWKINLSAIIIIGAISGGLIIKKRFGGFVFAAPFFISSLSFLAAGFFLHFFYRFPYLIAYEQGAYASRIWEIGMLLIVPLFLVAAVRLAQKIGRARGLSRAAPPLTLAALMLASLYLSYPRTDKYDSTHGYNVGRADIRAVEWIERDAGGEPYIVLANQSVSAAALKVFGFAKFYKTSQGEIFFYPIPTSGPLYEFYLKMVYEMPTAATAQEAMRLVGVKRAYLVVNHYWTNARRVVEEAEREARHKKIIDGRVYVFKYNLK